MMDLLLQFTEAFLAAAGAVAAISLVLPPLVPCKRQAPAKSKSQQP
jgi:hypothetical protein